MIGSAPARTGVFELRREIDRAESVVVLSGAGISAESGIPTFRGPGGLWRNYSPEQLATPEAFRRNPGLVWEWYDWRRGVINKAAPNRGHLALAQLERRKVSAEVRQFSEPRVVTVPDEPSQPV